MLTVCSLTCGLVLVSMISTSTPVGAQSHTDTANNIKLPDTGSKPAIAGREKFDKLAYDNALFEKLNEVITLLEELNGLRKQSGLKPLKLPVALCLEGPLADECDQLKKWFGEDGVDDTTATHWGETQNVQ